MYILNVSGNGCGNAGPSSSGGLGKRIVDGLAAQLEAQLSCESRTGTAVTLEFPMRERARDMLSRPVLQVPAVA